MALEGQAQRMGLLPVEGFAFADLPLAVFTAASFTELILRGAGLILPAPLCPAASALAQRGPCRFRAGGPARPALHIASSSCASACTASAPGLLPARKCRCRGRCASPFAVDQIVVVAFGLGHGVDD